jgi:DNA-binding response OmpR family regulator
MASRRELGNLTIDRDRFEVIVGGDRVNATFVEFDLLDELAKNAGRVLSREHLLAAVWGDGPSDGDRKLTVHISRLRKKLRGSHPWRIETVAKRGYALANADES